MYLKRTIVHTPRVEHVCEVPTKEDPLIRIIPGSSVWSRLKRWLLGMRIVSRRHPFTGWYLKSNQTIDYEIYRHLKSYPYMCHPFSTFRLTSTELKVNF